MPNKNQPIRRSGPMGRHRAMTGEKAKDFKGTVKKLIKYMGRYKIRLLGVLICAVAGTIFNIIGPKMLGDATSEVFEGLMRKLGGTGGINFEIIIRILTLLLTLYITSAVFAVIQGWIMTGISNNVTYSLRRDMSRKINRIPLKYFEGRTHGEVLSRITNDIDTLGHSLNQSLTQLIRSAVTLLGVFLMMLSINILMTLVTFIILPLSVFLISMIMKRSQGYFRDQQRYLGELNGHVEEAYSGLNIIKAYNKEKTFIGDFQQINERLYASAWRSQFFSGMMMPIMQFIGNLGYVAVALLGSYLSIKNVIRVGHIQAFIQYVRNFTHPIQQVAQITNMLQSAAAASERVFEFLEEKEETPTPDSIPLPKDIKGNVSIEHVSFGYDTKNPVIQDFSIDVTAGQRIAIVGHTGAGKTTIVKLLMRFYDVDSGSIKVDGHDLRKFDREDIRNVFGMVLQDTWLFKGTIMDNIRYGRLDATEAEVIAAAKAAYAHDFIMTMHGGYNMILNEEVTNISQGQKQLLTIARAFLADRKILILDEATSSVDTLTEISIQRAMDRLMEGRTSFVIAHRLSTIRNADLILYMEKGVIIEKGNHEELIAKNGAYADLYNSQFERVS